MGRPRQSPDRLSLDATTAPALESFLSGLGLDQRAITESPPTTKLAQLNLNLYPEERAALDDAASTIGIKRAGTRLARAIVRSWLAHRWNHFPELVTADLGEGHRWSESLAAIRARAEWIEGQAEPGAVFATIVGRLERDDLLGVALGVVAQLSESDRAALRRALGDGK